MCNKCRCRCRPDYLRIASFIIVVPFVLLTLLCCSGVFTP